MWIKRPICVMACLILPMILWINCRHSADREPLYDENAAEEKYVTGTVKSKESKIRFGKESMVLFVETKDGSSGQKTQIMCYLKKGQAIPYIGQTVTVCGEKTLFPVATNPGEFNQRNYYQILNISYKLINSEILFQSKKYSLFKENMYRIKRLLELAVDRQFTEPEAGVIKAMLLGDRSTLESRWKELYQFAGIIHVLAISGVHISLLGMGLYRLLYCLRLPKFVRITLTILVMYSYAVLTGGGISCIRALVMFGLKLLAELLGRCYDMISALTLAGIGILCEQPLYLRHSGFLMSFLAVLGICYVLPCLQSLFSNEKDRGKKYTAKSFGNYCMYKMKDSLLVGIAIAITILPVQLYFHYMYSLSCLLVNLLVVPTLGVLLLGGSVATVCSLVVMLLQVSSWKAGINCIDLFCHTVALFCEYILRFYEKVCTLSVIAPVGTWVTGKPEWWQILVYYLLLFGIILYKTNEKRFSKYGQIPVLFQWQILLVAFMILCRKSVYDTRIHFLDVGQGDCIVIVNDNGKAYMIDGGSTSKSDVGKYQIEPFLKSQGICEIEAVFVTHPDEDHINGIEELLINELHTIRIKQLILPDISDEQKEAELAEICEKADAFNIPVMYMHRGQALHDEELTFLSLNPKQGNNAEDINELSQVLAVSYCDFELLLTADVTGTSELELCKSIKDLQECDTENAKWNNIDILKVAHHGSKYSTPAQLLDVLHPKYAVISAGKENAYGHPHEETLERLDAVDSHILSTAKLGAICVRVQKNSGTYNIHTFIFD